MANATSQPESPAPLLPSAETVLAVHRSAPAHAETDWQAAIASIDRATVEVLKQSDSVAVVRAVANLDGSPRPLVFKTEPQWGLWNRLRAGRGWTRLDRHWKGARLLALTNAFPTAECLSLLSWKSDDSTRQRTLVMEALPGTSLLHWLDAHRSLPARDQHAMASAVGTQTRSLLAAGLFNRDHKPSNIIVTSTTPPQLALIDTASIGQTGARAPEPVRPLASLFIEPIGCSVAPRLALAMHALKAFEPDRAARRKLWHRVASAVRAHSDPTPKDNPLHT